MPQVPPARPAPAAALLAARTAAGRRGARWARSAVRRGLPPRSTGWRFLREETLPQHLARRGPSAGTLEELQPPVVVEASLPHGWRREDLPDDRGWWGFSFQDVPARQAAPSLLASLADCRVTWYRDERQAGDFVPAVVAGDGTALSLRQVRFDPRHGAVLRRGGAPVRLRRATWVLERVWHNHSHWLTAHIPKLLLLAERDALGDVLLPRVLTPGVEGSLQLLGLDPADFPRFDEARPLRVAELTVLDTDRFRPDLVGRVQTAFSVARASAPHRRVFVSRSGAARRRLLTEDALWPMLRAAGFERVRLEELSFSDQVALMRETAVLAGPHGAGLTNMVFCPRGALVVELADLGFPNPNFYALATALGHRYALVPATPVGVAHPLERDLEVDVSAVSELLAGLVESATTPPSAAQDR